MPVQPVKNKLDHRTGADNEEEIDIIQSALEKSSLSLDLEESSVSLELSSTLSSYSNTSVEYSNLQNCPSVAIEEDHFLSPHVEENVISSGFLWVGVGFKIYGFGFDGRVYGLKNWSLTIFWESLCDIAKT